MNRKFDFIYFVLIGILLSIQNPLPKGVHAWAQADRLSLSMNFLNTNNILEPSTHCLQTENGRVGCEFPLIPYITAKFSQISNLESSLPFLYRNFVWCFWILGLFMLSKIFQKHYEIERNRAIFLSLILHSSPILIFYGNNFLMDVPAYGLIITAFYFFIEFSRKPSFKFFAFALLFSALASALKISALLYFGSFMAAGFITALFSYNSLPKKYLWYILFLVCCLFLYVFYYYNYYFYVKFNKDNWSYVFLSESRPIESLNDVDIFINSVKKWGMEIFTLPQWIFLISTILFSLFRLIKNKSLLLNKLKFSSSKLWFFIFFIPAFLVLLIFLGFQFEGHDYYFIVPFLPLTFIYIGKIFPKNISISKRYPKSISIAIVLISFSIFLLGFKQSIERSKPYYTKGNVTITTDLDWLKNGDKILTEATVSKESKIFVLYEFSMNIHLVHFDRMGLIVTEEEMNRESPYLEEWTKRIKPEYYIFRNHFIENFFSRRPEFKEILSPVFQNQDYTVWKLDLDKFFAQ